jgi:hypothetical protein
MSASDTKLIRVAHLRAACTITGKNLACSPGDMPQGSYITIIQRVVSNGLPRNVNATDIVNKITASCGSGASCKGEGSAALQVRTLQQAKHAAATYAAPAVAVVARCSGEATAGSLYMLVLAAGSCAKPVSAVHVGYLLTLILLLLLVSLLLFV